MNIDTIQATCDGRSTGRTATDWGIESLPCNTTTGLTSWIDTEGKLHRACYHHLPGLRSRYPERYRSELQDDPLGQAKAARYDREYERTGADPAGLYGAQPCWLAGHVPGCAGKAGGDHELEPGWITTEIDGQTVEVEVS